MLFILARSANKVLIASADTICVQMNLFAESVVQSCGAWVAERAAAARARGLSACVEPLIAGNDEPTAARHTTAMHPPPNHRATTDRYTSYALMNFK